MPGPGGGHLTFPCRVDRIAELRSYPCMIVSDNGTELTSNVILRWQQDHGVEWHYIAPRIEPQRAHTN